MEYQQFSFDNPFQDFQPMESSYDGHVSFLGFNSSHAQVSDLDLTNYGSLNQSMVPRGHPLMERFLTEKQRQPLFLAMPQAQPLTLAPPVASIPPAASNYRHASPSSSHEPSYCGSALSPGTDTDLFTDHMPSTPPDLTMFPSCQPAPFDIFKASSSSQIFLSGVGGFPEDNYSCVSLSQISPADEASSEWKESSALSNFGSPHPNYAFASQGSASPPTDTTCLQSPIERCYNRASTPAGSVAIKEEIHIPEQPLFVENVAAAYPTPSVKDSEVSDAEIDTDSPTSEADDDEDEYQPGNHKESSGSMRRSSRNNKRDAATRLESSPKRTRTASSTSSQSARRLPPSTNSAKSTFFCNECSLPFKDEPTLEMHIKKQHTRPFTCVFNFAGCTSNFASKNEWKRHVASQHLVLYYWLCDMGVCAHNKNTLSPSKPKKGRGRGARVATEQTLSLEPTGPPLPNGAIFNRKDLYTQHVRRMHAPTEAGSKSARASKPHNSASDAGVAASHWDNQVKALQTQAIRERCQLPDYMECPALHCNSTFSGADAWDQRMEHVARHLEKAALNQEAPVVFGGPTDMSLMNWATRPDVAVVKYVGSGHWQLNKPLQAASEGRGVGRKRDLSSTAFLSTSASSSVAGSSIMSCSIREFSAGTSVKSETFMDEGDEDAEGEDE